MRNQLFVRIMVAILLSMTMILSGSMLAQRDPIVEPLDLTGEPIVLAFSTQAAGAPTIELLTDDRIAFRIEAAGEVTGVLTGSISANVSEVTAMPSPPLHPASVIFTIETDQGMIQGYYAGSLHLADDSDKADVQAAGQILSVSGTYADLYLADVYVSSQVQFVDGRSVGESGTLTIIFR